jgi:PDGF/VEGF domain
LRQAICQPIDTLISLIPENERDPTVFYFPSCVVVKKCGGCCAHSGTICSPLDEVERQVTVKKTKFVPTEQNKLTNLGDMSVTIKEHNKCKCLCKKTAEDCNSLQKFIKSQCRCECLNMNEAGQCAQVNKIYEFILKKKREDYALGKRTAAFVIISITHFIIYPLSESEKTFRH